MQVQIWNPGQLALVSTRPDTPFRRKVDALHAKIYGTPAPVFGQIDALGGPTFEDDDNGWWEREINAMFPETSPVVARLHRTGFGAPHFRVLGVSGTTIFAQPARAADIIEMSVSALKPPLLMRLAPLQWWEIEFGNARGVDWNAAVNAVIRSAEDVGRYNSESVVGRGVYAVDAQVFAHLGDHVRIAGQSFGLTEAAGLGGVIFAEAAPSHLSTLPALTASEAERLEALSLRFDWQQRGMGQQLAGWTVVAALSGALRWRPHLWLTGPYESGKSFVLNEVVGMLLRGVSVAVAGSATEAGIRQHLANDAWPVLIDEAEAKDERAAHRLAAVLELMRSAASSTGATIVKGGAGGKSSTYRVRSAFALASIDANIAQTADESRIVRLSLNGPRDAATEAERAARAERFAEIKGELLKMEREAFGARLFWRTLNLAPTILANADAFTVALTARTNSGRVADTLGPILAGWHSLRSESRLSIADAKAMVEATPWILRATERGAAVRDHDALLHHILASQVRGDGGTMRTVAELIQAVTADRLGDSQAEALLKRNGFRVDVDGKYGTGIGLLICRNSLGIKALCHGTQWASDPIGTLDQHPSASVTANSMNFGAGVKQRATRINLAEIGFFE